MLCLLAGAIRASSPVIVVSLLLLIAAFALSTMGNAKHNSKTVVGAVFYVIAGLRAILQSGRFSPKLKYIDNPITSGSKAVPRPRTKTIEGGKGGTRLETLCLFFAPKLCTELKQQDDNCDCRVSLEFTLH